MNQRIIGSTNIDVTAKRAVLVVLPSVQIATRIAAIIAIDLLQALPSFEYDHFVRPFLSLAGVFHLEVRCESITRTQDVPTSIFVKVTNAVHNLTSLGRPEERDQIDTVRHQHITNFNGTRSTTVTAELDVTKNFKRLLVLAEHLEGKRYAVDDFDRTLTNGFADEVMTNRLREDVEMSSM